MDHQNWIFTTYKGTQKTQRILDGFEYNCILNSRTACKNNFTNILKYNNGTHSKLKGFFFCWRRSCTRVNTSVKRYKKCSPPIYPCSWNTYNTLRSIQTANRFLPRSSDSLEEPNFFFYRRSQLKKVDMKLTNKSSKS